MNLEELRLLPKWDMVLAVNTLLRELNSRECYLIDWENPDMFVDHLEYHAADSIQNGKTVLGMGDKSDAIYCFFKQLKEPVYERKNAGSLETD
jgi:hypothetical protein